MKGYVRVLDQFGRTLRTTNKWQTIPDVVDYIIFKEGDIVKAKNGRTGEIEFEDSNASKVVSSALSVADVIAIIDDIMLTSTIKLTDNKILYIFATVTVQSTGGTPYYGIRIQGTNCALIGSGKIDGQGTTPIPLQVDPTATNTVIEGLYITGGSKYSFHVAGTRGKYLNLIVSEGGTVSPFAAVQVTGDENEFNNLTIVDAGYKALKLDNANSNVFSNVHIYNAAWQGISLRQSNYNQFSNVHIHTTGENAIYVYYSSNFNRFENVTIESPGGNGIELSRATAQSQGNQVHGIMVLNAENGGVYTTQYNAIITDVTVISPTVYGLKIAGAVNNIISNVVIKDSQGYGIQCNANVDEVTDVLVTHFIVKNSSNYDIYATDTPSNLIFADGWVTDPTKVSVVTGVILRDVVNST